jgi:hypothetical protein
VFARVAQYVLAVAASIWHNWTSAPLPGGLIAKYDH